ncbi:hypothetical protein EXU34_21950 [Alteromonas sp. ZYF713]|nr:hypothetical protein [Alteromonas sp. ZYF713]
MTELVHAGMTDVVHAGMTDVVHAGMTEVKHVGMTTFISVIPAEQLLSSRPTSRDLLNSLTYPKQLALFLVLCIANYCKRADQVKAQSHHG